LNQDQSRRIQYFQASYEHAQSQKYQFMAVSVYIGTHANLQDELQVLCGNQSFAVAAPPLVGFSLKKKVFYTNRAGVVSMS